MTRNELRTTLFRIRKKYWYPKYYIYFDDKKDNYVTQDGKLMDGCPSFDILEDWEYYNEPKKKKQITFYEYVVYSLSFNRYNQTLIWSDLTPDICSDKHTGNTKTVEIDED